MCPGSHKVSRSIPLIRMGPFATSKPSLRPLLRKHSKLTDLCVPCRASLGDGFSFLWDFTYLCWANQ